VGRLLATCAATLALIAPASVDAAQEPARLAYSVSVPLSAPLEYTRPVVDAGLCLAGANGAEGSRITALNQDSGPSWSPDGRRLAFSRVDEIFVREAAGASRKLVGEAGTAWYREPAWSPDGRRIAFAAGAWSSSIYSIRPDGSDRRRLTDAWFLGQYHESPAWAPDSRRIAFSLRWFDRVELYVIDSELGGSDKLAENAYEPSWSPDGRSIVFVRRSNSSSDLVIIGADGSGERMLTTTPENESDPAWSPDGQWIAFERDGDIVAIRPDGSGLHVVRGTPLIEHDPAWRPAGPRLSGKPRPCVIRGNARANILHGTSSGDLILAGRGNDSIFAGAGEDVVDGQDGADRILGGPGADVLSGGFGPDRLEGGTSDDWLISKDGEPDAVLGGADRDRGYVDDPLDQLFSVEKACTEQPDC
jgi:dipeptidyl aminopeptidase/acylaminoacyl peptidase